MSKSLSFFSLFAHRTISSFFQGGHPVDIQIKKKLQEQTIALIPSLTADYATCGTAFWYFNSKGAFALTVGHIE